MLDMEVLEAIEEPYTVKVLNCQYRLLCFAGTTIHSSSLCPSPKKNPTAF